MRITLGIGSAADASRSVGRPGNERLGRGSGMDLSCVMHVHSTYSDGTATVPEILATARAVRVDAVVLTDHDTIQAKRDGWEGWHDGVLLVVGSEISPRGGHLLAFGLDDEVAHRGRTEAQACAEVVRRGGFGIAAHPFSAGSRMSKRIGRPHPWPALEDPCVTGVELWSLTTDVAERWRSPREAWRSLRDPEATLDGPPVEHLRAWDALCARRPVVAIGGLDAHQPGVRIRGRVRSVMPHLRWFGYLRTHVVVDGRPDPEALLAAIRTGRCYLARIDLGDPRPFSFGAGDAPMGAGVAFSAQPVQLRVGRAAELRLVCDGTEVARAHGRSLTHRPERPGAYRAEAWRSTPHGPRRWIVTNPVYLR